MPINTDRGKLKMIDYLILDYSISTSLTVFWNNDIIAYFVQLLQITITNTLKPALDMRRHVLRPHQPIARHLTATVKLIVKQLQAVSSPAPIPERYMYDD